MISVKATYAKAISVEAICAKAISVQIALGDSVLVFCRLLDRVSDSEFRLSGLLSMRFPQANIFPDTRKIFTPLLRHNKTCRSGFIVCGAA